MMTVAEFREFAATNDYFVLKDSKTGREYTAINNYLDRQVIGCYARCNVNKRSDSMARAELVLWIRHENSL